MVQHTKNEIKKTLAKLVFESLADSFLLFLWLAKMFMQY